MGAISRRKCTGARNLSPAPIRDTMDRWEYRPIDMSIKHVSHELHTL
jgi:hypothetical protein